MPALQIRVLGELEVELGGVALDLGGIKPRALLGLLVAAEGRAVPVEQLIDQVWGDAPPKRVEASLQSYVARLRRALEPDRDPRAPAGVLRTRAGGYALDVPPDVIDARRFVDGIRRARDLVETAPDSAVDVLDEVLGLWRGTPYQGLGTPSLLAEATRYDELRLGAVADRWELRIARGEYGDAAAALEQLVREHPLRERLWALLALALYRSARQGDALAAIRRAREHLADELGVDPGPELRSLEEAILRQDQALDAPRVATAAIRPGEEPRPAPAESGPRMFGRSDALERSVAALDDARRGRGRVVLVTGEPGIGKSRFGDELAAEGAARGFAVGRGAWEEEPAPPLWAWGRALRQAVGSAEALDIPAADAVDAASASFRRADALVAALRTGPPALLVLDDAHWADVESVRLMRRVAADLHDVPAVLVVALRSSEADVGDHVADLLAGLARTDPVRVELSGLPPSTIAEWVTAHTARDVSEDVAAELARRTDGNPFYVTELVRLLVSEGALGDTTARAWDSVPGGVRDVVRQRLSQLPEQAVDVLRAAAVAGRSFDVAVVASASAADAEVVDDAVEAAQLRGLVDVEAPGRCRFTHALVRDALYETLALPQRTRLHGRVGAALEERHAGRLAERAAELAAHYRLAGPAFTRSAWVFARTAASLAAAESSHDEAVRRYSEAAELLAADPTADPTEHEEVLVGLARALVRSGRPLEAWAQVERAARSALARDDGGAAASALLSITEGTVWGWRSHPDYDLEAIELWREVLARGDHDEHTRARLTGALAVEHLTVPGAAAESTRLADDAIAAVRRSGRRGLAELDLLRLAQIALMRPDLLHHRMPVSDEIVEIAARLDHAPSLAAALTARAQDRGELGRLADVRSDVVRAQELAERYHLSESRMIAGWCAAGGYQLDGDLDAAERAIEEGEAFQATLAMSGNGIGMCQLAMVRDLQGRLSELEPVLRGLRGFHPGLRELHALAMVRSGLVDELRALLGPWAEQPDLTWDYLWLFLSAVRAQVWVAIGDRDAAADLLRQLEPYADRLAYSVPNGFQGSVRLTLGRLAGVLGDVDAAREHLEAARKVHADLGLPRWVDRCEAELAALG